MTITSSAFTDGGTIPVPYTYRGVRGGLNISLPFRWSDVPPGTRSFALSIVDPHPVAKYWVHWFVINIPKGTDSLAEGASGRGMPAGSKELLNTYGTKGYGGPEPPPGSGAHPYVVTLYALNVEKVELDEKTTLAQFDAALLGKMTGTASMTGHFGR
ncbi:MAG: YbhB/YbcL family Raf kinase inhibitor-like protein [Bacteroidetes bacterium]|nr:MAG: YbhB/YbcL family Raf kinase inhibitor-like protein [Bacteroidota bacterium]